MARLIWLVLHDGRSVVANCELATRVRIENVIADAVATLTLASGEVIEEIPTASVRDFVLFDAKSEPPPATAIHRLLGI